MNFSNETKTQFISALKTFGIAFIVTVVGMLSDTVEISWTWAFFGPIVIAGLRAAITALIAPFIPASLGGKKV
jgi:hypothetical protein